MLISMLITADQLLGTLVQSVALFVVATFVFDAIHFSLHVCLNSRYRWLRRLASPHEVQHVFFDGRLRYHEEVTVPNLLHQVIPEYATQMVVCGLGLVVLGPLPVIVVMSIFTLIFARAMIVQGKDHNHIPYSIIPAARETLFVRAPYHAMHHIYPDSYLSSYTTLFDGSCHRRFVPAWERA
jgi:monoglucosyldiacylglycerol epimerase